ncbi:HAD hydrolase-like protein [Streptomyces sp. NPDC008092]|uniref:HAD hydrolase-like protein n=1 Tax=Streptomyces sp. NPDC008092 TaxID=3364808 RepID=UPI0036E4B8BB
MGKAASPDLRDRVGSGRPPRTWMVGDNPVADIAGARAAGIPGILVNPGQDGLQPAVRRILDKAPWT